MTLERLVVRHGAMPGRTGQILREVGPRLGIAREAHLQTVEPDDPDLFMVSWTQTDVRALFGLDHDVHFRAGAAGVELGETIERAYAELVERYAASAVDAARLRRATAAQLRAAGEPVAGPTTWPLFHPRQRPRRRGIAPFRDGTRMGWIQGVDLGTGTRTWLPAQLVYLGYRRAPDEPAIAYGTSDGLAAGPTIAHAVRSGLYEVIEHDAFSIAWHARHPPRALDPRGTNVAALIDRRLRRPGLEYHLFDLTHDLGVPVVFAVCEDRSRRAGALAAGLAAHRDPQTAARKAVLEAAKTYYFAKQLPAPTSSARRRGATDLVDTVALYAQPGARRRADFLFRSTRRERLSRLPRPAPLTPSREISDLRTRLGRVGLRAYAVRLTTSDAEASGLEVVRSCVPGAAALGIPALPFLGTPRLREVPYRMGWSPRPLAWGDLNRAPHPLG